MTDPSLFLVVGFCLLLAVTIGVAVGLAKHWGDLRLEPAALGIAAWLALTGSLAWSGALRRWDALPPPIVLVFGTGLIATLLLSRSGWARQLAVSAPTSALVGFQAFRFPLELLMHRAYSEGLMPVQMSFSGRNFDIVTGLLGVVLGLWAVRRPLPRWVLRGFNLIGLGLLINVVTIAIRSMPLISAFGPDQENVWVTYVPFVWLPTVFVTLALFGHLLLFQRLRSTSPESA